MDPIKLTHRGAKDFEKLPPKMKKRIGEKLLYYASLRNPLVAARPLINLPPATHRYRVGKYRISFFVRKKVIFVERVELRGRAYRR